MENKDRHIILDAVRASSSFDEFKLRLGISGASNYTDYELFTVLYNANQICIYIKNYIDENINALWSERKSRRTLYASYTRRLESRPFDRYMTMIWLEHHPEFAK